MMSFETNQKQINKLDEKVNSLDNKINGGFFGNGLEGDVVYLKEHIRALENNVGKLTNRVRILEEIVRESGLITDFTEDEVKIREDRKQDLFGNISTKNVPYQINKVKVL